MAKLIGLIGSLQAASLNRCVFNEYSQLIGDHSLEEGVIATLPLYNQDHEAKPPESVLQLAEQVTGCDGIIFFSPEYNYSIPGVLKNAIDWLSRMPNKPFDGKACTVIGASPGAVGTGRMQYHLRQVAVCLNLQFMNKPEVLINGSFNKVQDGKVTDTGTLDYLQKHSLAFIDFIEQISPQ